MKRNAPTEQFPLHDYRSAFQGALSDARRWHPAVVAGTLARNR